YTHLCLGLLRDDAAMLGAVREAMVSVCAPTPGDGIQTDRSFHQHGPQLYTGGYGGSFANDVAKYALLTRGSEFALPPGALAGLAEQSFAAPSWPSGHQHYFTSDYTVHRRPGWFASIKMFSSRTKSGESTNDENLLGSRQSDGRFALTLDGNEWYAREAWPAL